MFAVVKLETLFLLWQKMDDWKEVRTLKITSRFYIRIVYAVRWLDFHVWVVGVCDITRYQFLEKWYECQVSGSWCTCACGSRYRRIFSKIIKGEVCMMGVRIVYYRALEGSVRRYYVQRVSRDSLEYWYISGGDSSGSRGCRISGTRGVSQRSF